MNFKNNFLVSLPVLNSGNFNKSLVYLDSHTGDGAHGWIVNKQLEEQVATKLRRGMKLSKNIPIYYGGPVDVNSGVVIHSKDFNVPATKPLNDTLSITRDKSIINILNMGQMPEYFRIIVGCCAWGPTQLENEILGSRTNGMSSWTTTPYSHDLMWNTMPGEQWNSGIEHAASALTSTMLAPTFQ
jgi:putative transcriptional regulator